MVHWNNFYNSVQKGSEFANKCFSTNKSDIIYVIVASVPLFITHTRLMRVSEAYLFHVCQLTSCLSVCAFQLRLTVAEAVGSMCHLMASDKLEEQIPKLIPAILSLYKKNNEHYVISKVGMGCSMSAVDCLLAFNRSIY